MNEALFGLIGLVGGAIIGFLANAWLQKKSMIFEIQSELRESLVNINKQLLSSHSEILDFYDLHANNFNTTHVLELKKYHIEVMRIYAEFRIYFGQLRAYELQSAVYKYYFKLAEENPELDIDCYKAYQALKDAYGLMINDVRIRLMKINALKKVVKEVSNSRQAEYKKYSKRLDITLQELNQKDYFLQGHDKTDIEDARKLLLKRIIPYKEEKEKV